MVDKSKRYVSLGLLLLGVAAMVLVPAASALPQYAAQTGLACGKCHVNPAGGGTRTAFGAAFAANGHKLPATKPTTPVVATKPTTPVVATKPMTPVVANPKIPVVANPKIPAIVVKPTEGSDELNENDDSSKVGKSPKLNENDDSSKVGKSVKSETEKDKKDNRRKHISD